MDVHLEPGWKCALSEEFSKPYFKDLTAAIKADIRQGKQVFPPGKLIFNAFWQTPFDKVKVVILGQDPYHGPGQAHGLSFSVPEGVPFPPSLQNIFKALHHDLGYAKPRAGDLSPWAAQGVLLLNASLTVLAHRANSHAHIGWHTFTDAVIRKLSDEKNGLVFLLWGSFAIQKQQLIDAQKHRILTAAHPSPLSAHRGFLTCRHFSRANDFLRAKGDAPIDWRLD